MLGVDRKVLLPVKREGVDEDTPQQGRTHRR
jgi:hypothetical protein